MALSGAIGDISSGIGDLFGSSADKQSAGSYDKAAALELVNARIAGSSTQIQETALKRQIYSTEGAQTDAIAGSGFASSGTALDLARDTAKQGALSNSLLAANGEIQIQDYTEKSNEYAAEATAARTAAKGAGISGILGIATGILGIFGL